MCLNVFISESLWDSLLFHIFNNAFAVFIPLNVVSEILKVNLISSYFISTMTILVIITYFNLKKVKCKKIK